LKETTNQKYVVIVDDNFHFMNQSERYTLGEFETLDSAHAACRQHVESDLEHFFKPGMSARALYETYVQFGEDPFVRAPPGEPASTFNARHYAKRRADEMCGETPPVPDAPPAELKPEKSKANGQPAPSKTSLTKSDDWCLELAKCVLKNEESLVRRTLAQKTQEAWVKMGKSGPPPDLWSQLEESARSERPPKLSRTKTNPDTR
jgi:hypothetical protein